MGRDPDSEDAMLLATMIILVAGAVWFYGFIETLGIYGR